MTFSQTGGAYLRKIAIGTNLECPEIKAETPPEPGYQVKPTGIRAAKIPRRNLEVGTSHPNRLPKPDGSGKHLLVGSKCS